MCTLKRDVGGSLHPSAYLRSRVRASTCQSADQSDAHKWCLYDFIIAACAILQGKKRKLRPVLSLPESIVIQPEPEGRELIIPRFAGIIEQMCFEIGHRTIEVPVVISSQTCMVCNAETQEGEEGGAEHQR